MLRLFLGVKTPLQEPLRFHLVPVLAVLTKHLRQIPYASAPIGIKPLGLTFPLKCQNAQQRWQGRCHTCRLSLLKERQRQSFDRG